MVRILIFLHGRPLGVTESARIAEQLTATKNVYNYIANGKQDKRGYAFDYALENIDYPPFKNGRIYEQTRIDY